MPQKVSVERLINQYGRLVVETVPALRGRNERRPRVLVELSILQHAERNSRVETSADRHHSRECRGESLALAGRFDHVVDGPTLGSQERTSRDLRASPD
jgi:hypothetical protein